MSENPKTVEELLSAVCYRRLDVENLLDPESTSWIRFDPKIGYVPRDTKMRDGIDQSISTYTHGEFGERQIQAYSDQPCRLNTYGDSFTQCQQVSDGETWQERLATHIGEPVRNFGIGGHGCYTQYLRAMEKEQTGAAAEYMILNCFVDDHIRNIDAARWIRTAWNDRNRDASIAYPLHGLPWSHLRYDLNEKKFQHQDGLCKNEQDLIALTEKDRFVETFRDDQIARLFILQLGGDARYDDLEALADEFNLSVNFKNSETRQDAAAQLHLRYGIRATMHIIDLWRKWCSENNRKLLIATSSCIGTLSNALSGIGRHDQEFIDYLNREQIQWFDSVAKHREDFERYSISVEDYTKLMYVKASGAAVFGHYTPVANMLYAHWIKDTIVEWLSPSPPAYRSAN